MNRDRRKELAEAITLLNGAQEDLESAKDIIDSVRDEEEEAYDNLPESLQEGEKGEVMQVNIDSLDEIVSELEDIKDSIEVQIDAVQDVIDL